LATSSRHVRFEKTVDLGHHISLPNSTNVVMKGVYFYPRHIVYFITSNLLDRSCFSVEGMRWCGDLVYWLSVWERDGRVPDAILVE
jgi:hypothetical protein